MWCLFIRIFFSSKMNNLMIMRQKNRIQFVTCAYSEHCTPFIGANFNSLMRNNEIKLAIVIDACCSSHQWSTALETATKKWNKRNPLISWNVFGVILFGPAIDTQSASLSIFFLSRMVYVNLCKSPSDLISIFLRTGCMTNVTTIELPQEFHYY